MEIHDKSLTTLLFKEGFPDEWKDSAEFQQYLSDLCSFSMERLGHEVERLTEERANVLESTKELAYDNYPTFIETAKCSREILQEFTSVEEHIGGLLTAVPPLMSACENFLTASQAINTKRKLNSLTLSRHTQLLEILEIPQVMETCVRNNYYEEALELRAHVKQMERKHVSSVPIVQSIVDDVQKSSNLMLTQLLQQLRTNIQLPACLRVIGYLRRMEVFNETELRLKFLQARDTFLQGILADVPNESAYQHLSKTIEASRVHLFDIMTQYRAIFPDDDPLIMGQNSGPPLGGLFYQWVNEKICDFLQVLEKDLARGMAGRLDSIVGQCMYFGLSFSRIGADFRALLVPIFQRSILQRFTMIIQKAKEEFHENMQKFTMISPRSYGSTLPLAGVTSKQGTALTPPQSLMDFLPLSQLSNQILAGLNEVRQCAAIAVSSSVHRQLVTVMECVVHELCEYHRIERRSFSDKESEQFTHYCRVMVQDFLPHVVNCFTVLFPSQHINDLASRCPYAINQTLTGSSQEFQIASRKNVQLKLEFNLSKLVEPLKLMLPDLFTNDLYIADSLSQHTPPVVHSTASGAGDVPTEDNDDVIRDDVIVKKSVDDDSSGANDDVAAANGKVSDKVEGDDVEELQKDDDDSIA